MFGGQLGGIFVAGASKQHFGGIWGVAASGDALKIIMSNKTTQPWLRKNTLG
jgi:hypothetical protein